MPDKPKSWETSEHKGRPRSNPDPWFSQLPPEEIKLDRTVKSLVNEAKKQNNWLYDPKDKRWYTPEEYLDLKERFTHGIQPEIDRIEIRDPIERINDGFAYIKEFKELDKLDKFKEFVVKVINYYRG